MKTSIIKIWCDYDIGQDYYVFNTKLKAMDWLTSDEKLQDLREREILDEHYKSITDLINANVLDFETITLIQ